MQYKNIAITGASSGLGRALALAYAGPGITLHLAGRDRVRLAEVGSTAEALGAKVTETILDVTDLRATDNWINRCEVLDLVIANAGISYGPGTTNMESAAQIRAIFATNVLGVFNTILPAIAMMGQQPPIKRKIRGRIAIIGSIAGLIALPTAPTYSASKAALDFWVNGSAPNAKRDGIRLTIVRPGFIRTPLTARNPYKMPGLMDADDAAKIIIRGLKRGKSKITFPWWLGLLARIGQRLPKSLMNSGPKKPSS